MRSLFPKQYGAGVALLVLLTLAVFSPLLLPGEFFWDDFVLLVDNPLIKSADGLRDIWLSTRNPDYFPLTSTTFWMEWRLWGMHPQGYHLTNMLLHAGSSVILWRILRRLEIPGAMAVAALFAVHPVNVESVAWIAERKNTLSMFCLCVSAWCFLRAEDSRRWSSYLLAIVFFLMALLAKTAVVMAPFVLLLLLAYRHRRWRLVDARHVAPFFALSLILGLVTIYFQYRVAISDVLVRDDPVFSRVAIAGRAVWFYVGKVLWPVGICFNYPRWPLPAQGALAFLPLGALMLLFACLIAVRRRWAHSAALAIAGYVIMLAPMLGLLNIFFMRYALVSDHWQYHATPILLALIVATIVRLFRIYAPGAWSRTLPIFAFLLVTILGVRSFLAADIYRTPESIWRDTIHKNPDAWLAHANLGELLLTRSPTNPQDLQEAIGHLAIVTELQPGQALAYTNLGNAYVLARRPDEALAAYAQGLRATTASADELSLLHFNLGALYAKRADFPRAESHIEEALRLNRNRASTYLPALLALARIEATSHHTDRAVILLNEVLSVDPANAVAESLVKQMATPATSAASAPAPAAR